MERTYMNCNLGGQLRCPQHDHPFMRALFAGVSKDLSTPAKELTTEMIDNANSLCKGCKGFSPKHQG